MTIAERLHQMERTPLGHVTYGALEAAEHRVMIFPVPLQGRILGRAGIVFFGDAIPTKESMAAVIEYLNLARECLPEDSSAALGSDV